MKHSIKRKVAFFMAMVLILLTIPTLAINAAAENVQLIASDGTKVGSYGTLLSAHNAAISKKLDYYTLKMMNDVELDGGEIKLVNKLPTHWILDGNGKKITQPAKGEKGVYITGNNETEVYIRNLTVEAQGTAVLCEAGKITFISGSYKTTNPSVWDNAAVECKPVDEYNVTVNIRGGSYVSEFTVGGNDEGKIQSAVRLFANSPLSKAELNIYGGYFLNSSANTEKSSDCVLFSGATAKVGTTNIYGGTFVGSNTRFVLSNCYKSVMNVYGGNFEANLVRLNGADVETVINNESGDNVINVYTANMISGGNAMIGNRGSTGGNVTGWKYFSGSPVNGENRGTYSSKVGQSLECMPKITTGAALKMGDTAGIRFTATVKADTIEDILALADEGTELSYGMIITGADLTGVRYNTADALKQKGIAYADIKATNLTETSSGGVKYGGAISGIKAADYGTKFNAIPYVEATINGAKVRFYALYDGLENARSISDLATQALADVKNVQDTEYTNDVGGGNYSPYTEAQRAVFSSYIVG